MPAYRRLMGDMTCQEDVTITAMAKGNIRCHKYELTENATHHGHVEANEVEIAGIFEGDIQADFVRLKPTAKVTGLIHTQHLSMEEGAAFNGQRLDPPPSS
jgi:Integral membrane protein CcmA involved in cell shape determination